MSKYYKNLPGKIYSQSEWDTHKHWTPEDHEDQIVAERAVSAHRLAKGASPDAQEIKWSEHRAAQHAAIMNDKIKAGYKATKSLEQSLLGLSGTLEEEKNQMSKEYKVERHTIVGSEDDIQITEHSSWPTQGQAEKTARLENNKLMEHSRASYKAGRVKYVVTEGVTHDSYKYPSTKKSDMQSLDPGVGLRISKHKVNPGDAGYNSADPHIKLSGMRKIKDRPLEE